MLREAWRLSLPPSVACVSQPLRLAGRVEKMGQGIGVARAGAPHLASHLFPQHIAHRYVTEGQGHGAV